MPVGYDSFTYLLKVIGIFPLSQNISFHVKTWIPNILWFGFFIAKFCIRVNDSFMFDDDYDQEWNETANYTEIVIEETIIVNDGNSHPNPNRKRISTGKITTVILFFLLEDLVYRTMVIVIRFRRRFILQGLKDKVVNIEDSLIRQGRYKRRILRWGYWFLGLNFCVLIADVTVDVNDIVTDDDYPYFTTKGIALSLVVNVTLSIVETITSLAVEGLLIYYCLFFQYVMREFNEILKEFLENLRHDSDVTSLQEKRLRLTSLHSAFEEGSNALSPLLAASMFDSLLTVTFGIFYVDKAGLWRNLQYDEFFNKVLLKLFLSHLKILIMCIVSEYAYNEATKTYRILSGVKLPRSVNSAVKEEMILLHLTRNSISFRFTLGGFCELKKSLLPTIAGAVITYTVILCQD